MRNRNHRVQVWLNDSEYEKLNKEAGKTAYPQSTYLRLLIEGNTVMECPKDYQDFETLLWKIDSKLNSVRFNDSFTETEKQEVRNMVKEMYELIRMLRAVYFPYFKWKKENAKQPIGFIDVKEDNENVEFKSIQNDTSGG